MADAEGAVGTTRHWLKRYLLVLSCIFLGLSLLLTSYNLYESLAVGGRAVEGVGGGGEAGLTDALEALSSPHIFAGYENYHGFGKPQSSQTQERVSQILAAGRPYSSGEMGFLVHHVDHYLTAFKAQRVDGKVGAVPQDWDVARTIIQRHNNAISNTWIFVVYLAIVGLMIAGLLFVYEKKNLYRRIDHLNDV